MQTITLTPECSALWGFAGPNPAHETQLRTAAPGSSRYKSNDASQDHISPTEPLHSKTPRRTKKKRDPHCVQPASANSSTKHIPAQSPNRRQPPPVRTTQRTRLRRQLPPLLPLPYIHQTVHKLTAPQNRTIRKITHPATKHRRTRQHRITVLQHLQRLLTHHLRRTRVGSTRAKNQLAMLPQSPSANIILGPGARTIPGPHIIPSVPTSSIIRPDHPSPCRATSCPATACA